MFALGIVDKLTPGSLTGGAHVAGTGTIDDAGHVGTIGGIPQKMIGARNAGATVFLVPPGNCAEALRNAARRAAAGEGADPDDRGDRAGPAPRGTRTAALAGLGR